MLQMEAKEKLTSLVGEWYVNAMGGSIVYHL